MRRLAIHHSIHIEQVSASLANSLWHIRCELLQFLGCFRNPLLLFLTISNRILFLLALKSLQYLSLNKRCSFITIQSAITLEQRLHCLCLSKHGMMWQVFRVFALSIRPLLLTLFHFSEHRFSSFMCTFTGCALIDFFGDVLSVFVRSVLTWCCLNYVSLSFCLFCYLRAWRNLFHCEILGLALIQFLTHFRERWSQFANFDLRRSVVDSFD